MSSFMTLQAHCDACDCVIDVYADELFDFDCVCKECGGALVLHEGEGDDGEDEAFEDEAFEDEAYQDEEPGEALLRSDHPTKSDTIDDEPFGDPDTREDTVEVEEPYRGGDLPTKADTLEDDPYAMAAMALDPTGSDRYRRAQLDIEPASSVLAGTPSDLPPLPAWDGGDTQQVHTLANQEPEIEGARPVDMGSDLASALGDLVEVVEVTKGTGGRGSRTYDAEQGVLPTTPGAPLEEPKKNGATGGSLFGEDLDWLALIDDRLPDPELDNEPGEEEEGVGRVIIRLPEGVKPALDGDSEQEAQLQQLAQTMEHLESGGPASLGSLIMDGFASGRFARRYEGADDEDENEDDTRSYGDSKQDQEGEPTQAHSVIPGEPKIGTKRWAAAFAEERGSAGFEDDGGPTRAWPGARNQELETPTQNWSSAAPTAQPETAQPATEQHETRSGSEPRPPSSRHQRRGDGTRVIDRFRREDLDPALVCAREVGSPEADYFRQLYQQIFQSRNGDSPRSVLITSAHRGEGKTTIAANLAIAAARVPGRGVVLVDADPRGAGVLRAFGERSPMEGVLEALETGAEPRKYAVQFNLGQMDVVPLGIRGSNAAELIASEHMGDFLRGLRSSYPDWPIIVDGSSILHSADPLVLAQLVDGVVLVVRAGGPQEDEVQRVTELLGRERLLGVVLNDARGI